MVKPLLKIAEIIKLGDNDKFIVRKMNEDIREFPPIYLLKHGRK